MRLLLVAALALGGCKVGDKPPPTADDARVAEPGGDRPVRITAAEVDDLDFTYAGLSGRFRRARGMSAVPVVSRKMVRVTWPTAADTAPRDDGRVHVVDLTRPDDRGGYTTAIVDRFAFEVRALAALPPGATSHIDPLPAAALPARLAPHDRVVVYGTRWCGATKQVLAYLAERFPVAGDGGSPAYVFRDVGDSEVDPVAIDDLSRLALAAGIVVDRVPIIDVRGKLLVGFDERRLDTLLGDRL